MTKVENSSANETRMLLQRVCSARAQIAAVHIAVVVAAHHTLRTALHGQCTDLRKMRVGCYC